jgi:hypothetical protein
MHIYNSRGKGRHNELVIEKWNDFVAAPSDGIKRIATMVVDMLLSEQHRYIQLKDSTSRVMERIEAIRKTRKSFSDQCRIRVSGERTKSLETVTKAMVVQAKEKMMVMTAMETITGEKETGKMEKTTMTKPTATVATMVAANIKITTMEAAMTK